MYPQQQNQDILSKLFANKKLLILIIVGVVALLITIVTLLANSGSPTPGRIVATQTQLENLSALTSKQSRDLQNGDLRDQNANIGIILAGAKNDLAAMSTQVYGEKTKPDERTLANNAARLAALEADFESARNTNTLDTTYQEAIVKEVATIEQQLVTYASTIKGNTKETLVLIAQHLKQGREAFEKVQL